MANEEKKGGLKSSHKVEGSTMTFTCVDKDDAELQFSVDVDMAIFGFGAGALANSAIAFAVRTALRNSTGGCDIEEAEEAVNARLAAWTAGEWGVERGGDGSGDPFTPGHILSKAVLRVYGDKFPDGAAVAKALSEKLAAALSANGHPAWAELDDENKSKARNAFVKNARKDAAVDLQVTAIAAEQAAKRLASKQAKTGGESTSLF